MKEARVRYDRGKALYNNAEYEQALIEFERAYELAPAYRILYNIGQAAVVLQKYPKAIKAFEGYLAGGKTKVSAKRRKAVEKEIASLYSRVAYISVTSNVEGVEVLIDDDAVGTTPIAEPVMVNAGRHVIIGRKTGHAEDRESVTLAGKEKTAVKLELELFKTGGPVTVITPGQPPPPTPATPAPQPPPQVDKPSYVWIGWVVTGAFTAGAIATGIAAIAASSELTDLRETRGTTKEELDEQQSTGQALALSADVLAAAAIVTGGVTLYFTIAGSGSGDEGLDAAISPTSIGLSGRF